MAAPPLECTPSHCLFTRSVVAATLHYFFMFIDSVPLPLVTVSSSGSGTGSGRLLLCVSFVEYARISRAGIGRGGEGGGVLCWFVDAWWRWFRWVTATDHIRVLVVMVAVVGRG